MKDVHQIVRANRQVEGVEVDLTTHLRMHAAQIDDQLVVDEHPHVVIAHEAEHLADATVCKLDVYLAREQVVVATEACAREDLVHELTVEWVVRRVCVRRDECLRIILQCEIAIEAHVDTRYVGEPLP